jgi:phytoene synthase
MDRALSRRRAPERGDRRLLALADEYYRSGDLGVPALPARAALAVRTARAVYSAIGARLARAGYDVLAPRAVVPGRTKLALALRAALATLAEAKARISQRFRPAPIDHVLRYPHDVLPV